MNSTNIITALTINQRNIATACAAPDLVCDSTPADEVSLARASEIKRITGYANAVTALLETFDFVAAADQADILAVACSIADDVAGDLAALVGSAA